MCGCTSPASFPASECWAAPSTNDSCPHCYSVCSEQPREQVTIRTGAGIKKCTLTSHNEAQYEFEIAMGEPQVGDEFSIKLAFGEVRGIPVSMGNPHYVVFVNEFGPGWQAEA